MATHKQIDFTRTLTAIEPMRILARFSLLVPSWRQSDTDLPRSTPIYPDLPRTPLAPSTDAPPPTPTPGSASRST